MTILAPTGAPPKRHLDVASDVADDFRPRESTTGANGSSLRIAHLGKFFHPAHGGIERTVRAAGSNAGDAGLPGTSHLHGPRAGPGDSC